MPRVRLRRRRLRDGTTSLYLDTYRGPTPRDRDYEFLGLYLTGDRASDTETLRLAEGIRLRREAEYAADQHNAVATHKGHQPFMDVYLAFSVGRHRNFRSAAYHLEQWSDARRPLRDIDAAWLERLKAFLRSRIRMQSTIAIYYGTVEQTLRYAVRQRWIAQDPTQTVDRPPHPRSQRVYLIIEELGQMVTTPSDHRYPDVRSAFLFACATGLRLSDVRALRTSDVQSDRLAIRQRKTRQPIYLPLSTQAVELLRGARGRADRCFDLPSESTIRRVLREWAAAAGITKSISFHVSRHTFATLSLMHGGELVAVSRYLGHSNVQTTMTYLHIVDDAKRRAADAVPNFVGGQARGDGSDVR